MAVKGKLSGHITVERYLRKILFALVCEAEMSAVYIQYGTVTSMCSCVFLKFPVILLCILVHENGKKTVIRKIFYGKDQIYSKMYRLIIFRQSCEITFTLQGSPTLNAVAENLTSTPARACHDVMLRLNVTTSKFMFHNLNRKSSEARVVTFYGGINSSYCQSARCVSGANRERGVEHKKRTIGALVLCLPIQDGIYGVLIVLALIVILYLKIKGGGMFAICLHWRFTNLSPVVHYI